VRLQGYSPQEVKSVKEAVATLKRHHSQRAVLAWIESCLVSDSLHHRELPNRSCFGASAGMLASGGGDGEGGSGYPKKAVQATDSAQMEGVA